MQFRGAEGGTLGWKCSLEFEVIHVGLFDIEARPSPSLFTQTAKRRAGAGKYHPSFLLLCLLVLRGVKLFSEVTATSDQ